MIKRIRNNLLLVTLVSALPMPAIANKDTDELRRQVEALQRQLAAIQEKLAAQEQASKAIEANVAEVTKTHSEWKSADSVVHLSGYASLGYTDNESANGRFSQVQFSPIFHYQYKDLVMLETELEINNTTSGETNIDLEYLALDLFLHDNATLVAGKFLSPIGQFRQNLHPGWINKMPSAPPGFGHDGAAPISDTGLQLRGGLPLGGMRANYAVYAGNGPVLASVTEGGDVELEGIVAEGRTSNADGNFVWGGRLGLLPMTYLELGLSMAKGRAAVTSLDSTEVSNQPARSYDVLGADMTWHWGALDMRGEFVQSKVGSDASAGSTASDGSRWRSWYAQASYPLFTPKFEGVVRYTDFDSPHVAEDQRQWALGINYLFSPTLIGKAAYELNEGQSGSSADQDSMMLQLSYGF